MAVLPLVICESVFSVPVVDLLLRGELVFSVFHDK
jgi:hypothetical protein